MNRKGLLSSIMLVSVLVWASGNLAWGAFNPNPPASTVKLIFIHHSTGENWLADSNGDLGIDLRDNNYFVSDTNYGWGPSTIGDHTDIGHWWDWFRGPSSSTYLSALYSEYNQNSSYSRLPTDPGGPNEIIMFKSCFPNSHLGGSPSDPPTTDPNPLRSQDAYSPYMTVANAKGIYNDILVYFTSHQEKLFIVITAPPLAAGATDASHAANARAFNDWLVNNWLTGYAYHNVAVFDFYNVLTSNGGNPNTNDAGLETGNHHRWWSSTVQHIQTVSNNVASYPSGDSHPTSAGNQKATSEFVDLLNIYYHCWKGTGDCPSVGPPPCIDNDVDGYGNPASAACTYPLLDCDDANAAVNPGATELCDNAIDDDCDGLIDSADSDCGTHPWGAPTSAEASSVGLVSHKGSSLFNILGSILLPIGMVLFIRILRSLSPDD